jgi:hypothetical protein
MSVWDYMPCWVRPASESIGQALYCVPGDLKRGTLGNGHVFALCSSGTARDCTAVRAHGMAG